MAENENKDKKIIIDEDWKVQAQKEKESIEQAAKETKQESGRQLPPADFFSLVSMLATQALFAMGLISESKDKKPEPDFEIAKYNIDIIGVIEEKTKGNLTGEEQEMITGTLHQLRMAYVQLSGKA